MSAVRNTADFGRPIAGPNTTSTSATPTPYFVHPVEDGCHAEGADPIGDEVRGVLAVHNALAEDVLTEPGHVGEDLRIGVLDREPSRGGACSGRD